MARRIHISKRALLASLALAAGAVRPAMAVEHVWLDSPATVFDGTFNDPTHWDNNLDLTPGDGTPGAGDTVYFGNAQSPAYTVGFNADITTQQFRIATDKIIYDLAGNRWISQVDTAAPFDFGGGGQVSSHWIATQAGEVAEVTFSSSVAAGDPAVDNVFKNWDTAAQYRPFNIGGYAAGSGKLNVNTSLGFGVTLNLSGTFFLSGNSEINVDGVGSEITGAVFPVTAHLGSGGDSTTNITNGGKFTYPGALNISTSYGIATVNVETGSTFTTGGTSVGQLNTAIVTVKTGGTWNATDVQLGLYHFYDAQPISAKVTVDGATSSFNTNNITMGTAIAGQDSNAELILKNSGVATVKGTLLLNVLSAGAAGAGKQVNTLTLDTGVLQMDGLVTDARLIDNHGQIRGNGTINRGAGLLAFTVQNNSTGEIRPGDMATATPLIGTINIDGGSYNQTGGGTLYLNFGAAGAEDLINITNGTATLDGNINFLVLGGYTPVIGDVYDFVRADSISYSATDNIGAALVAAGYAGPYFYGVVNEGGVDVLRLEVPEPASMGLLALGGILMLRRRRMA